jgi:hypothetical protein
MTAAKKGAKHRWRRVGKGMERCAHEGCRVFRYDVGTFSPNWRYADHVQPWVSKVPPCPTVRIWKPRRIK